MNVDDSFLYDPDGTQEEILQATYWALCEHGYANLTVQRIGEHFEKSVSLLYQHYDGKDDMLLAFLSEMLEEFERSITATSADEESPCAHLDAILDHALAPDPPAEVQQFESAMVELRAQAATDERYRRQFTRHDRFFRNHLASVVRAGIDEGTFRDVDPVPVTTFMFTVMVGTRIRRATTSETDATIVRKGLKAYLDAVLYAPE